MAGRIERVRGELQRALEAKYPSKDWSFITKQIGMFSFTGLTPAQVRRSTLCPSPPTFTVVSRRARTPRPL